MVPPRPHEQQQLLLARAQGVMHSDLLVFANAPLPPHLSHPLAFVLDGEPVQLMLELVAQQQQQFQQPFLAPLLLAVRFLPPLLSQASHD